MKTIFLVAIAVLTLYSCTSSDEQLARKADRIHESILTVDTHCDTPMELYRSDFDLGQRHDEGCVDFPRMKDGGLDAEFFAVFIGQGPRDDSSYNAVHSRALEIFGAIHANLEKNRNLAGLATSYSEALSLKKEGRLSAFIGVENGYPIGKDLGRIKEYYDKGARYITLCHTKNNDICDSSTDQAGAEHNGLSEFGQEVVREMNRLGMMIDVSHISDSAFYDVLKSTNSPVIASHSSCRALCENPRNLSDNMLLALKENGGVIQICILSAYLKAPERNPELEAKLDTLRKKYGDYNNLDTEQRRQMRAEYRKLQKQYEKLATVKDAVDHIDHVIQVIGIDHVGIGTDFDGGGGIEGCKSVADMKNFTLELLKRGYSKSDIEKIWGGNVMRVLTKVEQASVLNP
jgi:membrane dipeptidase